MNKDQVLVVLYDLTLTIGSEVTLDKLLPKVMQRFMFHLSYPVGMVLRHQKDRVGYQIICTLGDYALTDWKQSHDTLPWPDAGHRPKIIQGIEKFSALNLRRQYCQGAWLPIDHEYGLLLLTESSIQHTLAVSEVFTPVLRNLEKAISLCKRSEQLTTKLTHARDEARTQLALALQASEHERTFLASLKNTIPDMFWLKDVNGVYLSCNTRFEEFFGHLETEIIGKTDYDFVPKEMADFFRSNDRRAMEADKLSQNEEWLTFASDGYEGLFQTTKVPMRDERGELIGVLGIAHDITELKAAQDRLQLSASVFGSAREGIMITSPAGIILEVNETFCQITGYNREETIGKRPNMLSSGRHTAEFYQRIWSSMTERGHWSGEIWNRRKNGEIYPELLTITAVKDLHGELTHYVALFADITELKRQQKELERMAHFDQLTGLANRSLLADRLSQGMSGVDRRQQTLMVAFLDFDGFKQINDQFGHQTGDKLLTSISNRMGGIMREGDTLSRWGGDEFVAVFLDLPNREQGDILLQRLLSKIEEPVDIEGKKLEISASIGVTYYPQSEEVDADQLLRQADQAMYQAKLSGKGRIHLYDPMADKLVRGHNEAIEHIHLALVNNEFELFYQPKVNMRSGELIGLEALIRWRHPERGLLPPAVFIPAIENHPIAIEVGQWVIRRAIADIKRLEHHGVHTSVSVNVSGLELQQPDFVSQLANLLREHPTLKPGQIELELLESSALQDINQISEVLRAVQLLGISSAIDDFGTGYSSLTYLKRLPANTLKIDQSFVRGMIIDPEDVAILEGIIGLAKAFDRHLIAEGVETVEHGVMLLQLGCEFGQGYGIARPMPIEQLMSWLTQWQPDPRWREIKPLKESHRPLFFAGIEHRAWVTMMEEYLRGMRKAPPPLNAHQCQFGKWMQTLHYPAAKTDPLLQRIDQMHKEVHQFASDLVALAADNQFEEALAGVAVLQDMRDQLLVTLEKLLCKLD